MKKAPGLIIIVLFLFSTFHSVCAPSGKTWFLNEWTYRKNITIDNSASPETLKDFQMFLRIPYDSNMQEDFGDLRFTWYDETNGKEVKVDYWVGEFVLSDHALVWIKVPSIRASGNEAIYMYFGNPYSQSESSGHGVFIFFDDFTKPEIDLTKWIVENSHPYPKWRSGNTNITHFIDRDVNALRVKSETTGEKEISFIPRITMPSGFILEYELEVLSQSGHSAHFLCYSPVWTEDYYGTEGDWRVQHENAMVIPGVAHIWCLGSDFQGYWTNGYSLEKYGRSTPLGEEVGVYHIKSIVAEGITNSNQLTIANVPKWGEVGLTRLTGGGVYPGVGVVRFPTPIAIWFNDGHNGMTDKLIHFFRIRKYASIEPAYFIGVTESAETTLPFWTHLWFWAVIALGTTTAVFGYSTIRYYRKSHPSKKTEEPTQISKPQEVSYKVCPNCGAKLPIDSAFCGKCGSPLK